MATLVTGEFTRTSKSVRLHRLNVAGGPLRACGATLPGSAARLRLAGRPRFARLPARPRVVTRRFAPRSPAPFRLAVFFAGYFISETGAQQPSPSAGVRRPTSPRVTVSDRSTSTAATKRRSRSRGSSWRTPGATATRSRASPFAWTSVLAAPHTSAALFPT